MPPSPDPSPDSNLDSAEANMRRALGLGEHGGPARPRPEPHRPRPDAPPERTPDRSMTHDRPVGDRHTGDRHTGDRHRTRFVQDGDVPVTVVNRRPHDPSLPVSRIGTADPALASERAARERAERGLAEALAVIRDLRTKHAHAELAWQDAASAARRSSEAAEASRSEARTREARLCLDLAAEQAARAAAERDRDAAQAALLAATQLATPIRRAVARRAGSTVAGSVVPAEADQAGVDQGEANQGEDGLVECGSVQEGVSPELAGKVRRARKAARTTVPQPVKWWIR